MEPTWQSEDGSVRLAIDRLQRFSCGDNTAYHCGDDGTPSKDGMAQILDDRNQVVLAAIEERLVLP